MIKDIILKGKFENFLRSWDLKPTTNTEESTAFEKFVNFTIMSLDSPSAFIGKSDLLDFCSPGGGDDGKLDGVGIKINGTLIGSQEDIDHIVEASRKIDVEFILTQAKKKRSYNTVDLTAFGFGLQNFFSESKLPENDALAELRELKDYIYNTPAVYQKMEDNPRVSAFFVVSCDAHDSQEDAACVSIIKDNLKKCPDSLGKISVEIIDTTKLKNYCKELENEFSSQFNICDSFPLTVSGNENIKKAYAFTCSAVELLKLLTKEDGTLRRSLFNDNVRDYLGEQGSVNSEIENTILHEPEMFLMCNNGITIVCSGFLQIKDKLVRIDDPQIVNGCQTCNTIFRQRACANINRVQVLIKLICTDNNMITNKVVRGTNKQNQILDESFETTKSFHQELEEYFLAKLGNVKIYYERRIKQYASDSTINKYQIVNLRILTQTFTAMFLRLPHIAHRHEAKLLHEYAKDDETRVIFSEKHSFSPYYICALTWMKFEEAFRKDRHFAEFRKYKAQLYYIFTFITGRYPIDIVDKKNKGCEDFCNEIEKILLSDNLTDVLTKVRNVFQLCVDKWISQGKSRYGIKDAKEFTDLMTQISREVLMGGTERLEMSISEDSSLEEWTEGKILSFRQGPSNWFAFIKTDAYAENVYFDDRSYFDNVSYIIPGTKVRFIGTQRNRKGESVQRRAKKVEIIKY